MTDSTQIWRKIRVSGHDSFDANDAEFIDALIRSVREYGSEMTPAEASDALRVLKQLERHDLAADMLQVYMAAQIRQPRAFYVDALSQGATRLDPDIKAAFRSRILVLPSNLDVEQVLSRIATNESWSEGDISFLATVDTRAYYRALKALRGETLSRVIAMTIGFEARSPTPGRQDYAEITHSMRLALLQLGKESPLNALRVAPHTSVFETAESDPELREGGDAERSSTEQNG